MSGVGGAGGAGSGAGDSGATSGGVGGAGGPAGGSGVGGTADASTGGFSDEVSNASANAGDADAGPPSASPQGGVCTAADPTGVGTAAAGFNADPASAPSIGAAPSLAGPQSPASLDGFGLATPGSTLSGNFGPAPGTVDTVEALGQGLTGYRGAMYGEVGVPGMTTQIGQPQRFGEIRSNTTLADRAFTGRGYGIDAFAKPDGIAQRTMVGSQATYGFAQAEAARLGLPADQVTFELRDGALAQNRRYDVRVGPEFDAAGQRTPVNEVKAGQTISPTQLAKDVRTANAGTPVNYQFARNPLSGHHGPTPAVAAQLNAASAATNGQLTHTITDVAPSRAGIQAVETAATVSHAARTVGRVAAPVALAADAYAIGNGIAADGGAFGRNATVATAGAAGGWGGVQAGAAIGALGGPAGAAVGAVVGGLIGAIGGGFLGGWGAESAARAATG